MSAPRVVHLSTVHQRRDVRIFEKQARSLAAAGYQVHLLVGDGRGDEVVDGVRVHDIGAPGGGRLRRMLVQPVRMLRAAHALRPALVHFHDPELLWVGLGLQGRGVAAVYDSHEDVPRDILSKAWIAPRLRRAIAAVFERFEDAVARRLSAVVGATPHIAARFARLNPRAVAINNYPAERELGVLPLPEGGSDRGRAVCYVGGIGRIRGVIEMVDAMERVDATLVMAGSFEDAETEAAARARPGWARVDYRGQVSREAARAIMASCRAGLLPFHPEPNHVDAQPNKMFEYMAAALPVVASDFPLWREVLVAQGAGLCVDPLDPAAIAAAITRLLDNAEEAGRMGRSGRALVLERYRWEREADRLCMLYRELIGPPSGPEPAVETNPLP